jgi:hypothetical protein
VRDYAEVVVLLRPLAGGGCLGESVVDAAQCTIVDVLDGGGLPSMAADRRRVRLRLSR